MGIRIALAGNPNCGKTTLFNELTGANQYVGNWPGVTVEKKSGHYKQDKELEFIDLPGIYSLSPYTPEEIVSRNFLLDERPDVVVNIVDATNMERNLYLTTQLLSLGLPVIVALNMMDLVKKNGDYVNPEILSERLGAPVVEISALRKHGLDKLIHAAKEAASKARPSVLPMPFDQALESAIFDVEQILPETIPAHLKRWHAIKALESDAKSLEALQLDEDSASKLNAVRARLEEAEDDDAESIVAAERYGIIAQLVDGAYVRKSEGLTMTQKIDRIVTNRWLGLPIFALIMFLVYYISVSTVGSLATEWANDGIFGDGWLYTNREAFTEAEDAFNAEKAKIDAYITAAEAQGIDVEPVKEAIEAEEPSEETEAAVEAFKTEAQEAGVVGSVTDEDGNTEEVSDADFDKALEAQEPDPAEFGFYVPGLKPTLEKALTDAGVADWLKSLLINGILAGVGAVLGFVPQLVILFILLALLESCGYLARVAFIMDRIFRRFGLSGKSFIPMLIASGCGVPAIMATKTIENERDRRMTIMTTTMIPCGAKLPIIALVFGALANANSTKTWWVAPTFYFLGVFAIVISGIMLKKTKMFAGEVAPFVMELPSYHLPGIKTVLRSTWERTRGYLVKAGTIIFLSSMVIWFLLNHGIVDGTFTMLDAESVDELGQSFMANIGNAVAWIFAPLGFGDWAGVVTSITGLVAKENVVATVGVLSSLGEASEADPNLWGAFAAMFGNSLPAVISFCAFNLLCAPCIAAMATIRRQMESAKWTWFAIGYMTLFAWVVAFILYQFAIVISGEAPVGIETVIAGVLLLGMLFQIFRPMPRVSDED